MRTLSKGLLTLALIASVAGPLRAGDREVPYLYESRDAVPRRYGFVCDNPKFNRMWTETIVEILSRQLRNGQLIESSRESNMYPNSFPRNVCPLILVKSGYTDEVKKYLDFLWRTQKRDGSFWNYFDRKGEGGGIVEEDGGAYVVYHTLLYARYSGDTGYLKRHWVRVRKALDYLKGLLKHDVGLYYSTAGYSEGNVKGGYNIYHQAISMLAFESGAAIAEALGKTREQGEYLALLEEVRAGVGAHLVNEREKRYYFQLKPDGTWFDKPFPAPLVLGYYDRVDPNDPFLAGSVDFILSGPLYGEYSDELFGLEAIDVERATGSGFWMGQVGHGWMIPYFLKAGRLDEADHWFRGLVAATDERTFLVPEHINWGGFDPDGGEWDGRRYGVLPDSSAWVDPGNLYAMATAMHVVFTMIDVDAGDPGQRVFVRIPVSLGFVGVTNLKAHDGMLNVTFRRIEGGEEITLSGRGEGTVVVVGKDPEGTYRVTRDGRPYETWRMDAHGRLAVDTDFRPHVLRIRRLDLQTTRRP